jgi:hypothetical protein
MIHLTCPHCASKLSAKDELLGQTRKCPKCANPVQILAAAPPADPDESATESLVQVSTDERLPVLDLPDRLTRDSHYLICDRTHLVAFWENNGAGWMFRSGAGFASAKRNRENLPTQGDFKLIELKFSVTPEGKRLVGLAFYQLATRWALTSLDQGDDAIVGKITGPGTLNRDQKNAVRQALKDHFMRQVWDGSAEILEYLGNADAHSSTVGQ